MFYILLKWLFMLFGLIGLNYASFFAYQYFCFTTFWLSIMTSASPICNALLQFHSQGLYMYAFFLTYTVTSIFQSIFNRFSNN